MTNEKLNKLQTQAKNRMHTHQSLAKFLGVAPKTLQKFFEAKEVDPTLKLSTYTKIEEGLKKLK